MREKELTRKDKFEDYRPKEESGVKEKKNKEKKEIKKVVLNPLIVEEKKKRTKKLTFYYCLVTLFAITLISVLLFVGIRYL